MDRSPVRSQDGGREYPIGLANAAVPADGSIAPNSIHVRPAVDVDQVSGDVRPMITCQIHACSGYFLAGSPATQGNIGVTPVIRYVRIL
jgi:hypothetical protein